MVSFNPFQWNVPRIKLEITEPSVRCQCHVLEILVNQPSAAADVPEVMWLQMAYGRWGEWNGETHSDSDQLKSNIQFELIRSQSTEAWCRYRLRTSPWNTFENLNITPHPALRDSKTHVETGNIWDKLNNESRDTNKSAVSTKAIVQPP